MAACWSAPPEAVSREGEDLTPPCSGVALGEMGRQGKQEHPRQDPQRDGRSEGQSCWHLNSLLIGISLTQSTTSASPGLVPGNLVKRSISLQIRRKLYMDLSGRMNMGKWSPLSWKTCIVSGSIPAGTCLFVRPFFPCCAQHNGNDKHRAGSQKSVWKVPIHSFQGKHAGDSAVQGRLAVPQRGDTFPGESSDFQP